MIEHPQFHRATKSVTKARVALIGASGTGKTFSALQIAKGLANGGRVALIDTENASASKYADEFAFDTIVLKTFAPDTYVEAMRVAVEGKYDVLIIDSLSHAWAGKGGVLEMVDEARPRYQGNSFTTWREVTPKHNRLVEALIRVPLHLIVTMRAKTEYATSKDEKTGRMTVQKIGLQPVQRDGLEYEFDVVGDMDQDCNLVISKSRVRVIENRQVIPMPTPALGAAILSWLNTPSYPEGQGGEPERKDAVVVPQAQPAAPANQPEPTPSGPPAGSGPDRSSPLPGAVPPPRVDQAPAQAPGPVESSVGQENTEGRPGPQKATPAMIENLRRAGKEIKTLATDRGLIQMANGKYRKGPRVASLYDLTDVQVEEMIGTISRLIDQEQAKRNQGSVLPEGPAAPGTLPEDQSKAGQEDVPF